MTPAFGGSSSSSGSSAACSGSFASQPFQAQPPVSNSGSSTCLNLPSAAGDLAVNRLLGQVAAANTVGKLLQVRQDPVRHLQPQPE